MTSGARWAGQAGNGLCPSCAKRQGKRFHWCGDRFGCTCSCSRPKRNERRVLLALLADAPGMSGYPLSRLAQVSGGTVYIILARLERLGWIDAEWGRLPGDPPGVDLSQQQPPPRPPGNDPDRGRRRFYRLSPVGREQAMRLLGLKEQVRP